MPYAEGTSVSPEKTRAEIERVVRHGHGGRSFSFFSDEDLGIETISFKLDNRQVRFSLPMPDPEDFLRDGRGRIRAKAAQQAAYDQEIRRLWRCLLLIIKAKLEAVKSGARTVDEEFLADTVMGNGETVGRWLNQLAETGHIPPLLLPAGKEES